MHECIRTAVLCIFYNFFVSLNKACHLGRSPVSGKPRIEEDSSCIQHCLSVYTGQTDLSTETREKQHHWHICLRESAVAKHGFTMNSASSILSTQSVTATAISARHLRLRSIPTTWRRLAGSSAYNGNPQQAPAGKDKTSPSEHTANTTAWLSFISY